MRAQVARPWGIHIVQLHLALLPAIRCHLFFRVIKFRISWLYSVSWAEAPVTVLYTGARFVVICWQGQSRGACISSFGSCSIERASTRLVFGAAFPELDAATPTYTHFTRRLVQLWHEGYSSPHYWATLASSKEHMSMVNAQVIPTPKAHNK